MNRPPSTDPIRITRNSERVCHDLLQAPCFVRVADNPPGRLFVPPTSATRRSQCERGTTCYNRPMRLQDYAPRPAHLKWLLDSDPAIRWQVMRDLTAEAPNAIATERSRVATEGWGAQLLALQSPAGNWGGPKEDRGLLITLYTLVVLKDLGLDPASKEARKMIYRLVKRLAFKALNNRPFLHGETEPCINGRILGIGSLVKECNRPLDHGLPRR